MIWGLKNNERILPNPISCNVVCPLCKSEVIAKCGSIKVWHWAHKSLEECDNWSEGETEWHKSWKDNFPKEQQEVVVGKHRADIKLPSGKVVELQNSSISPEEIQERERYYAEMIWLLRGDKLLKGLQIRKNEGKGIVTFRWKHPAKSLWCITKPFYIDLSEYRTEKQFDNLCQSNARYCIDYSYATMRGHYDRNDYGRIYKDNLNNKKNKEDYFKYNNKILLIKKIHNNLPCGGYGKLLTKEEFLEQIEYG